MSAYEALTGEDAKYAFSGTEEVEYYYNLMNTFKINVPGTPFSFNLEMGMVGPGEDWIYATCLGDNAGKIYLGCYSGKVYCMTKQGVVTELYNCHDVIELIREKGQYLFIQVSNYCLYIVKNNKYLTYVNTWDAGDLKWWENGFMFVGTKSVRLLFDDGTEIGNINFKDSISDVYWTDNNLNVLTTKNSYMFSVS